MRLIQKYLPHPRHTEINRVFVKASPEESWNLVRHLDASQLGWIRLLFDIRTLPDILSGKAHESDRRLGIDQITEADTGFFIAEEKPGQEIVVASAGQFWHLQIPFKKLTPSEFIKFEEEGWGKLAWSVCVEPYLDGSTISLELRTTATDNESWKKLHHYYQVIGIGSRWIRHAYMKYAEDRLGKMEFEPVKIRQLPGDDLLPGSSFHETLQVNIEAPPSIVWGFLMQLGCDRAGWYSVDLLDHGAVPSTPYLIPNLPDRISGERMAATPQMDSFFEVLRVEPEKELTIGGETKRFGGDFKMNWSFILEPLGEDATHFISRARMTETPSWAEWIAGNFVYPLIHGFMSGVQLRTLKKYAEENAGKRGWAEKKVLPDSKTPTLRKDLIGTDSLI